MSKLIYITHVTLDGYIEDENGSFAWSDPAHVFDFITELIRPVGTQLLGRRLYEMMAYWDGPVESYPPEHREFVRVWQQANQIVFSRTLPAAPRAHVERQFNPETIRQLKRDSAHDIFIGGAELAGHAFAAGLVDECHLFIHPVFVGGGKPAFRPGLRQNLELLETRPFASGAVYVRYRAGGGTP